MALNWAQCGLEGMGCDACSQGSPCSDFLGLCRLGPTAPAQPSKHQEKGCPVTVPPCGYCWDDCCLYYKTETGVLGWRGHPAFRGSGVAHLLMLPPLSPGFHATSTPNTPSSQTCLPKGLSLVCDFCLSESLISPLPCPGRAMAIGDWMKGSSKSAKWTG